MDRRTDEALATRLLWTLSVALFSLLLGSSAEAEEAFAEGVAGSGMSQGSGSITTRSDVTMSVESLPGTSALRLGAIGEAVGTQMTAIRGCYVQVTEQRPTVQGSMQVRVQLGEGRGGRTTLEISQNTVGDQELTDCVLAAIQRSPFMNIRGPSGGMIVIQFQNTAAEGAALVAREREQATAVVQVVNGHPQASAATPQNEVSLTIAGAGDTDANAVAELFRGAQARIGMLLDCRRRAGRRGANPGGELVLSFRVPVRGAASGSRVSSSVADSNAPQCVLRALTQSARGQSAAAGTYRVTVRFAPR